MILCSGTIVRRTGIMLREDSFLRLQTTKCDNCGSMWLRPIKKKTSWTSHQHPKRRSLSVSRLFLSTGAIRLSPSLAPATTLAATLSVSIPRHPSAHLAAEEQLLVVARAIQPTNHQSFQLVSVVDSLPRWISLRAPYLNTALSTLITMSSMRRFLNQARSKSSSLSKATCFRSTKSNLLTKLKKVRKSDRLRNQELQQEWRLNLIDERK